MGRQNHRMPPSELLSLTWEDVDFIRRVITVRAAYAKNGESRSVPMNEVLTATLQAVRMMYPLTARCSGAVEVRRIDHSAPRLSMRSARQVYGLYLA